MTVGTPGYSRNLPDRTGLKQAQDAMRGDRRARLSAWSSLAAMAVGASLMWRTPWVDLPSMSTGILVTYAATAGLVWLAGIQALIAPHAAHASLPAWAPAGWAFMHFAWPGVAATSMAYAVGAGDLGLAAQSACLLAALCLSAAAVATLTRVGVALTMQPPWPGDAPLPPAFSGLRSLPAWVALLATAALNLLIVQGPVRLLGA